MEIAATSSLMEDQSLVNSVLDNLPVAVFAKDASRNFRFVLWNKKQEEVTTIQASSALGKNDYDLFSEESADYFRSVDEAVLNRGQLLKVPQEIIETKDGREVHLRTLKIPVIDESSGHKLVVGISEDITEEVQSRAQLEYLNRTLIEANKELQETQMQLIQAEKLESIGRLAAGVAHEVKNPLALLLLGVDYLAQGIQPGDPNVDIILTQMREAIARADKIVRGLVDFSSDRAISRLPVKIHNLIDEVLLLVRHELTKSSTRVTIELTENLPHVFLDMHKFEQVLINLIINAVHAMSSSPAPELHIRGYTETISIQAKNQGSRQIEMFRDGDVVVKLEIIDNGSGIEPNDANRIFDPFFTTKATGIGTGLGLSVSRRIVSLHGGELSLTNRDDRRGAKATILLPTRLPTARVSPSMKDTDRTKEH